jgi:tetratricopeptide (TPR) repeat protein
MLHGKLEDSFLEGREFLAKGNTAEALKIFQELRVHARHPLISSGMGYCLAKERGHYAEAVSLCKEALRHDPQEPLHFLYLGRIHMLAGRKKDAIRIFKMGLRYGKCPDIVVELNRLGSRRSPVLPFLSRSNPINKYLGIAMAKLQVR